MRALITGMTGFVGGHLIAALAAQGAEIHGTLRTDIVEVAPAGTTGHEADVTDPDAMAAVVAEVRPDRVFHLAGAASVGHSFVDPEGTWHINVEGTRAVLEALRRDAPDARMVIALSGDEYGLVPLDELPVTEDSPLRPNNPYAESKVAAEGVCVEYRNDYGIQVVRLRAFNQLGPGQDDRFVLPRICRQVAEAEARGDALCRLELGNLTTRRDFLDVRDVVAAYMLLAEKGDPDRPYVAGTGRSLAIADLVDMVVAAAKIPVEVASDPSLIREGEQPDLYAEARALKDLGWVPRIPIEQSITDTLDYWRARALTEVD